MAHTIVGWHQAEGMLGECYFPPDYAQLEQLSGLTARKQARSEALDAMLAQWGGQRNPEISFSSQCGHGCRNHPPGTFCSH